MEREPTDSWLTNPSPGTPIAPRTYGPMRIPATRYAVTAGSFNSFATRESISPEKSAIDKLKSTCIEFPLKDLFLLNKKVIFIGLSSKKTTAHLLAYYILAQKIYFFKYF